MRATARSGCGAFGRSPRISAGICGIRGQGRAACAEFFAGWFQAFPDTHVDVHNVYFIGDVAVEQGTFTGTRDGALRGPTGDIPPTGRAVSVGYIQVLRFRDGTHTSFDLMFDRLAMLEQLGLSPDSTPAGRADPVEAAT